MNAKELKQLMSRRFFLQGTGAVIALPFMASMLPRKAWGATGTTPPVRYMSYFVPLGMIMDAWTPTGAGANYTLSPTLAPLQPYIKNFTLVSGTDNTQPNAPTAGGGHAKGTGQFGTANTISAIGQPVKVGVSADQLVAQSVGKFTRLPSLQMGLDDSPIGDGQYSSNYTASVSWSTPTTNVPPVLDPRTIFTRLFPNGQVTGNGTTAAVTSAAASRAAISTTTQKSILDAAVAQTQSLQKQLGVEDGQKLDQFLTGIRQVEQGLTGATTSDGNTGVAANACVVPAAPAANQSLDQQFSQWTQLMTLAFQCDQTRVISFMFASGESYRVYQNLGIKAGHHAISHYNSQESGLSRTDAIAALEKIQLYEMQCFGRLLASFQAVKESNGTLLDNTVIMFSSELTDSDQHSYNNMPVILAGGAGGAIKTNGQHITMPTGTDYAQVLLTSMRAAGTTVASFGARNETKSLTGVLG